MWLCGSDLLPPALPHGFIMGLASYPCLAYLSLTSSLSTFPLACRLHEGRVCLPWSPCAQGSRSACTSQEDRCLGKNLFLELIF